MTPEFDIANVDGKKEIVVDVDTCGIPISHIIMATNTPSILTSDKHPKKIFIPIDWIIQWYEYAVEKNPCEVNINNLSAFRKLKESAPPELLDEKHEGSLFAVTHVRN